MKRTIFAVALGLFSFCNMTAQTTESNADNSLRVKANALFLPIGIINIGAEYQLSKKYTVQGDVFISPWKSFDGHQAQYYSVSFEGRYYFKEAFKHWYLGANIAASSFVLQKWNYWPDRPYINADNEVFWNPNLYQKGYSFLFGITAGYQFKISENWNMDIYVTAGSSQDFYKGYDESTGKRYDAIGDAVNRSGEIIPYRGGIRFSYQLK